PRFVVEKPVHPASEVWQPFEQVWFDGFHGEQRHQSHKRTHLEALELTRREVEHVIEELVCLVPQWHARATDVVEGFGDIEEMLEELAGDVLVRRIMTGQLQRNGEHIEAVGAHPRGAVRLAEVATCWQRGRPVEDADVVETEKTALEDVVPVRVFAI